jgi:YesN/AraC family two-component response regulator
MIRICIADDSASLVELLKKFIEKDPLLIVVGLASNGDEALTIVEKERPDVLLLDLSMPVSDGFFVLDQVSLQFPEVKIIVLSGHSYALYGDNTIARGANKYIEKGISLKSIVEEIKNVVA